MPQPKLGGYRRDLEDTAALEASSHVLPDFEGIMFEAPPVADPWTIIHQENQLQMGSCFPAGTKITLADGSISNIEDIEFGEYVISHTGSSRQVIDTMSREYTGTMVTISVKGWGNITMTADHVVLILRDNREQWIRADQVTEDDHVLLTRGTKAEPSESVDITNYLTVGPVSEEDGYIRVGASKTCPRLLTLDELTCFVLGLYVAEGSSDFQANGNPGRAVWTLHQKETDLAKKIGEFANIIGAEHTTQFRKESKAINVRVHSVIIADFLKNTCGRFANHKCVPEFILRGSEQQKLAFIRGYFAGDGDKSKYDSGRTARSGNLVKCRQVSAATASEILSRQLGTLCVSLGFKPGRGIVSRRPHQNYNSYITYLYSVDADRIHARGNVAAPGRARNLKESNSGQARKIKSITHEEVGLLRVYDFTVAEDHSFVANGIVVHNCQGHSLSTNKELCSKIATGDYTQLSRMYAYIETQRIDGLIGYDRGSTVWGGVQLAEGKGLCEETFWAYTGKYSTQPTSGKTLAECYSNAANHKLKKHVKMTSYEDVAKFIGLGIGGIHWGIGWNSSCEAKVCERYHSSWGGGGHSIPTLFFSPRVNAKGEKYIWMNNSWGSSWCNNGWSEWSPDFIRDLFDDRETVAYGLTDMDDPAPRPVDYVGRLGD